MKAKAKLICGTLAVTIALPLALQLATPTAANAYHRFGPEVTGVSPDSGPTSGGTTVTITGLALTLATGVLFGDVPASSYTVVSNTEIIATSPAESAGTVEVETTQGPLLGFGGASFTYS
jgi:hypothetical protein